MRSDWCSGCDQPRARRNMRFVGGWLYRCDHCRHVPVEPKVAKPAGPPARWPLRVAQVAASVVMVWLPIDISHDTSRVEQQQREHVAQLRQQQQDNEALLHRREVESLNDLRQHQIPYPPTGSTVTDYPPLGVNLTEADSPPLPNGSHYHCESSTFAQDVTGISLPSLSVGGSACSFRWPDGSPAPTPPH